MTTALEAWATGEGVISHEDSTRQRIETLVTELETKGVCKRDAAIELFRAADVLCNMALWLTVHMTYARNVYLDGRALCEVDFKPTPEGHTGGALNMVPAYIGYLLANNLTGKTRAWMMGQGHCVAAIDAVNVLIGNLDWEQEQRYPMTTEGLSTLCQDFYSYKVDGQGRPAAPLGSHVNPYTAGGISEGGYLGFAELQYPHMPLPGQALVTFLSDGAFEEQRGSDWAPRWWRGEDTGAILPIMIANGRRIDQRSTMSQAGGVQWLREHLNLNSFSPINIDGKDPAAFAWAVITMENELAAQFENIKSGRESYPVKLPYTIAETVKGYGFPGAGTNAAHNLPLDGNPALREETRKVFNESAARLFMPAETLISATATFRQHIAQERPQEKDHCLRNIKVEEPRIPDFEAQKVFSDASPMIQLDIWYRDFIQINPNHRFRVGNPDEMRSNRMNLTLDTLLHRVTAPEAGVAEAPLGKVITVLNEEAVICAALANKQGLNLAVSYEAFAVKMLGAMRQEMIFSRRLLESGREVNWISVPVILTSHTWENSKNEQSHQDPTLSAAWMQEMSDVAPVYFPFDANTAVKCLSHIYRTRGRIAVIVVPKNATRTETDEHDAELAIREGAAVLSHDENPQIQFIAVGAYQLQQVQRAAHRLRENNIDCSVVAIVEPGRFRSGRDDFEAAYTHSTLHIENIVPYCSHRIVVCHTHAEVMAGVLRNLDTGAVNTRFMGYRNRGGTLDVFGMLYANKQSWAHILNAAAEVHHNINIEKLLTTDELAALRGASNPEWLNRPV
ncbi:MAG: xylulose 5-phosphate 3-epimerase [Pseudohongiellaceae bacterium]